MTVDCCKNIVATTGSCEAQTRGPLLLPYSGYFSGGGGGGKIFVVFVVERRTTKFLPTKAYRIVLGYGLVFCDHENFSSNWPKIYCSQKFYPPKNTHYTVYCPTPYPPITYCRPRVPNFVHKCMGPGFQGSQCMGPGLQGSQPYDEGVACEVW